MVAVLITNIVGAQTVTGIINTFAGTGTAGFSGDGGLATAAKLKNPTDIFEDASGNFYICDQGNHVIRKVTGGIITTIAGTPGVAGYTGDGGLATAATLNTPNRVFVDGTGNIYIADMDNEVIRMVNTAGIISTIVGNGTAGFSGDGGLAGAAELSSPTGVAVDRSGNIFISDLGNNRIRKVSGTTGIITTYAGGGATGYTVDGVLATSVSLCLQQYVSVDTAGTIYITNHDCWHFLKVTTADLIYNVAGATSASYSGDCGPADSANVELPYGITPDNNGNIFLTPRGNARVRKVNTLDYISTVAGDGITGYAGDGGPATSAEVSSTIYGIYADRADNIYFADMGNNRIRFFNANTYTDTVNICIGGTDTLHSSTAISGTWISGDTAVAAVDSVTGVVTGISQGTAIITFYNVACPEFFLVHILNPTVSLGSDTTVCGGTSFTLASMYSYTVSPVSYTWSTGAITPTITTSVAGTYWLSVVEAGCIALADTITVNFGPAVNVNLGDDTAFCVGNSVTLQSSDTPYVSPTYLWSNGAVTPSINVSATGTYWLDVTAGVCTGSDTVVVTVKPLPPLPVLGSNSPVCSGNPLNLTATDTTGAAYSWTGPGGFTSSIQNPSITPAHIANSGSYSVIATLNGCVSPLAAETIVVDTTPVAPTALSNTPVCSGNTLTLTSSDGTSGVSYSWAGPGGFVSTLQNPDIGSVTTGSSGTYTVTAYIGLCSDTATTVVVINQSPPVPVLNSNGPVCSGDTLYLYGRDDSAAATISWTGPNGFTSNLDTPYIANATTIATGTYTAIATLDGCPSVFVTEAVLVDSTPSGLIGGSNSPICQGDSITLTSSATTPGLTYSWTGPFGFTSTAQNPTIYTASVTGNYAYVVTVRLGVCTSFTIVPVSVDSIPLLTSLTAGTPICEDSTLLLQSSFTPETFGIINWTGPNGFTYSGANPVITNAGVAASGVYSVSETLAVCTSSVYTIAAVVNPTPAPPNISSNTPVCLGDSIVLTSSDDSLGVSYSWSGPNGFTSTLENPFIINTTFADSGIYQVSAFLGTCKGSSSTELSITPLPTITPTNNGPLCSCTADTLFLYGNAQAGSIYSWSGPYNFSSSAPNPFITNITTENAGIYEVTAFLNNCYGRGYDTVVINQTPLPPFISWLTYCQYYPAPQLQANDTGVKWYPADTIFNPLPVPPTPSTLLVGSTFYFANLTVNGCKSVMDSVLVTVNPTPTVTVTPADTAVCPHNSYVLTAVDTDAITYYQWSPDIYLSGTTTAAVTVSPETSQSYTVVASNKYGCADTATASVVVHPAAVIYLGDSVTLYPGEAYTMSPSTNCTSFSWFPPAGLNNSEVANPVASPAVSTKYIVYGQTEDGCTTSDSISIYVSTNSLIDLPNAFTPGNGPNSEFKLIKKGVVSLDYFRIFNRWGQKVFETTNIDAGWDGTFNGTPQPFDVYVYEIQAVTSAGQSFVIHGNLTLLR